MDTPGIREFGLWQVDEEELGHGFPEFEGLAGSCRFSDCSHTHEPDCAIRAAVTDGSISESRYDSYLRLCGKL